MSDKELIEALSIEVEGENKTRNIQIFTLSTCMWCKKCKRYLKEKNLQYKYIDMDTIQYNHKKQILEFLTQTYKKRISYPFLVSDGEAIVGYDPKKYDEIFKTGGS
ncbi:MAG: glutaredoxin family protein [Promethearchaeota archaeon]